MEQFGWMLFMILGYLSIFKHRTTLEMVGKSRIEHVISSAKRSHKSDYRSALDLPYATGFEALEGPR